MVLGLNVYPVECEAYSSGAKPIYLGRLNHKMKNNYRLYITLIITILAALIIYRSALLSVITAVLQREGSSHGFFIPFLSGFFIWTKCDVIRNIKPQYDFLGLPLLASGLLLPIINFGTYQLHFLSFIVFIAGLIITFLGRQYFKHIAFPLFFLITMTPITGDVYIQVADYMRHITFSGSLFIISLLEIPFYREGWLMQLPNASLEVAISCSGIRYLISYFIFGLAYAYLFRTTLFGRITMVALTIPISITASIFRLTAIFMLTYIFGPHMSEYWPHVFISWSVFFAVLILAITADQFFKKRQKEIGESPTN
jgi:exosortase